MGVPGVRWNSTASWISSTPNREGRHDRRGTATGSCRAYVVASTPRCQAALQPRAARGTGHPRPRAEARDLRSLRWTARAAPSPREDVLHVYYVVLEPENLVRIVSVWGAMKGAAPSSIDR